MINRFAMSAVGFLGATLTAWAAHADYNWVSCESTLGTGHVVNLLVVLDDVKQVRIPLPHGRQRPMVPRRVIDREGSKTVLYSLFGSTALLEVEKTVLSGDGGQIRLDGDILSCDSF